MSEKKRVDAALVEAGYFETRERAKAAIMAGSVYIDGQKCLKPGQFVGDTASIEVRGGLKYVSRGGLKLEKAVAEFGLDLSGRVCVDVGASTGGFTDCMLQSGAEHVFAVDVGYGQLAWKLRTDERVTVMERTNARYLSPDDFLLGKERRQPDFASIDVSFISVRLILPALREVLADGAEAASLIKPQFEAGREKVGKNGVVRDKSVHLEVIKSFISDAMSAGFSVLGLTFSPVRGPEGNLEFLAHLKKSENPQCAELDISAVVTAAHETLT
ncbi:MAG: TlyA family RNA methyltransferase [Oscillospiraceae bacterium]|nr:TlyA family RNA methyltransferase [Oscillospiraceae bacterium]